MKIVTVYTGGTCKTALFILIETESKILGKINS